MPRQLPSFMFSPNHSSKFPTWHIHFKLNMIMLLILTLKPSPPIAFLILIKSCYIFPIAQAKNFGLILSLSNAVISKISHQQFLLVHLQNRCRIQPLLTTSTTILLQATIISCSDYYNSLQLICFSLCFRIVYF